MPNVVYSLLALVLLYSNQPQLSAFDPPPAERITHIDTYHGIQVSDPYRWLEELGSQQTQAWVSAQNTFFTNYLKTIPERESIRQRLTALWDYEKRGLPCKEAGKYYWFKNDGLQNQSVLYCSDTLEGPQHVVIDPNSFSKDGTVSLSAVSIDPKGQFMAYLMSQNGSDCHTLRVRDLEKREDLPDICKEIKFSKIAWDPEGRGFYYSSFREKDSLSQVNESHKVFFHVLGTSQEKDPLIYEWPDQNVLIQASVSKEGQYLILNVHKGGFGKNAIFYKDLSQTDSSITPLLSAFDATYGYIGTTGTVFLFRTNLDAPLGRVIAIDLQKPEKELWREVIPEAPIPLSKTSIIGSFLCVHYLEDVTSLVKIFDLTGKLIQNLSLPGMGTVEGLNSSREEETFYSYTNYITPEEIHHLDLHKNCDRLIFKPDIKVNLDDFVTERHFYTSKDGTKIPLFLSYKKGISKDGTNRTLLYGYGGFNTSPKPAFSIPALVWMELGGIYAVANIRGGEEYGETWHEAGMNLNKQNVFDDFIAAGETLIKNGYTSPQKLGIFGGSNGGLLVGACMNQRPDLFAACSPAVGVMDMLRFSKFTIGWSWVSDYGSPDVPEEFLNLYRYSPYHNIKIGPHYPACLITTADHDDRVVPGHSYKYAAALQHAQKGDKPILIRIDTNAGHGAGKPTEKVIAEVADRWAFFIDNMR